jgi:hypothetical protein
MQPMSRASAVLHLAGNTFRFKRDGQRILRHLERITLGARPFRVVTNDVRETTDLIFDTLALRP